MTNSRLLITGSSGFLGWNIARHFHASGSGVTGTWLRHAPDGAVMHRSVRADLTAADMRALLDESAADVVVHCAALSARKDCEADPARARAVSVDATRRLAGEAAIRGARFVFISTDLVFDGDNAPYDEAAPTSPLSIYAETKAEAERQILAVNPESYIIRTALMYGAGPGGIPGSFLRWTLDALRRGEPLRLFTNQYRTPLYAPDVARLIAILLAREAPPGIYHAAGPDRLSRFEIGHRVAEAFGFPAASIMAAEAERPAGLGPTDDCSLSTAKASALGMRFTTFETGLRELAG